MNSLQILSGKKTYLACLLAAGLLLADYNGWFKVPPQMLAGCGVLIACFLRSGLATTTQADSASDLSRAEPHDFHSHASDETPPALPAKAGTPNQVSDQKRA